VAGSGRRAQPARPSAPGVGGVRQSGPVTNEPRTAPTPPRPAAAARCFGDGDPLYETYHDTEWGVPVHGESALLERIALEGFQSGLSWIKIGRASCRARGQVA